uniref:Thiamine biosynthesis protein S n=1 Tax=Plagiogrammopsis vanheurckii TaxID=1234821 RepID=A0A2U9NNA5_9STRA|nr:thiamine biosynthesis protein S [Plagiogrammopsis vanheurckii]AWT38601.1 thiamine biosynthesis protein S [Plagiogrammopsis vanheurckii]
MSKIKTFFLNGQEYYTYSTISLLDLLNYFNYNSSLLVLEYNNFVCNKKNWNRIFISENDKIEIVTIVGGG